MASDRNGDAGGHLGWFLFGATLGALAGLLLAPRTGEENRSYLSDRGGELARRAQELAMEAQDRAGEWIDKGREVFEEQAQRLTGAFEAGREAMREEMRKAPPTLG
jgi:gas vesicle protein